MHIEVDVGADVFHNVIDIISPLSFKVEMNNLMVSSMMLKDPRQSPKKDREDPEGLRERSTEGLSEPFGGLTDSLIGPHPANRLKSLSKTP